MAGAEGEGEVDVEGLKRLIFPIGDGDCLGRYLPSSGDSGGGGFVTCPSTGRERGQVGVESDQ